MGVAGDVMTTGLWNLWYAVNTFLALALVGMFFAIPYRRLELQTVAEVFQRRWRSRRGQVLTSLCVQTEYLIVNILEPFVIGSIVSPILGIPFGAGVFLGAIAIIAYTALGGLWGSAATNLIHCAVVLFGLSAVAWIGLGHLGGWEALVAQVDFRLASADTPIDSAKWWSFTGAGWGAILAMFFSATIHTPAASVYVNFSTAAKTEKVILPAFLLGGLIASAMPLLAGLIGIQTLAAYGTDSGLRSYELITKLALDIGPWIGGMSLAAILAAVISSGGPILLASSTMVVRDWLPFLDDASDGTRLRAFRITTVVYGLLAALIAWKGAITSILELLLLGFAMVVPPAVAIGYVLYWKRTSERGCYWGMLIGYVAGLLWYGLIRLGEGGEFGSGSEVFQQWFVEGGGVDPSYVTTLVPLVLVPVISLLFPDRDESDVELKQAFYDQLARSV